MICLRSQLTLKESVNAQDVWNAICRWRLGSRNTPPEVRKWYEENTFENLPQKPTETPFERSQRKIKISVFKASENTFAFKLQEDTVITTICFSKDAAPAGTSGTQVSFPARRENFSLEIERTDNQVTKLSRPKIFDFLEEYIDPAQTSKTPLQTGNYSVLAEKINEEHNALPVIYVSKTRDDKYIVDPAYLAQSLYGVATVYQEPNNSFSKHLRELTDGKAAYNGAVGIYYRNSHAVHTPEKALKFDYFLKISKLSVIAPLNENLTWFGIVSPFLHQTTKNIKEKAEELINQTAKITALNIVRDLQQAIMLANSELKQKQLEEELSEVQEKVSSKDKLIEELQNQLKAERMEKENALQELEKIKRESEDFIRSFDGELTEKDEEIQSLKNENEKLQFYAESFKNAENSGNINVSVKCREKSLYPGEIEDFIKNCIFEIAKNYEKYGGDKGFKRLYLVLKDIYESNSDFDFENTKSFKALEKLSSARPESDKEYKSLLYDVGFQNVRKNGHNELYLYGDPRYASTVSSTSGDVRAMKNNAAEMKKYFLDVRQVKSRL